MNIKIGGRIFKVSIVDDLRQEDGKRCNGTLHADSHDISVASDISEFKQQEVIIHEALHAIISYFCIEDNEIVTSQVAHGIHALIVDNPDFIKGIINAYKKAERKQQKGE